MAYPKTYSPKELEAFRHKEQMSVVQSLINALFSYHQTKLNNGLYEEGKEPTPKQIIDECHQLLDYVWFYQPEQREPTKPFSDTPPFP